MLEVKNLMAEGGRLFITTCANAPAIDHVYLYDSVEHIQREIREAGFSIISEVALPVGNFSREEWARRKVEVNYGAMLAVR